MRVRVFRGLRRNNHHYLCRFPERSWRRSSGCARSTRPRARPARRRAAATRRCWLNFACSGERLLRWLAAHLIPVSGFVLGCAASCVAASFVSSGRTEGERCAADGGGRLWILGESNNKIPSNAFARFYRRQTLINRRETRFVCREGSCSSD